MRPRPPGSRAAILLHDGSKPGRSAGCVYSGEPPLRAAPLPPAPPLPSNGLPDRLDLKIALRVDLPLGGRRPDWVTPGEFRAAGRAGVPGQARPHRGAGADQPRRPSPMVFHLHGHHFRLLDRLDDGWKPFWLDTLAIEPRQTQRIAFAAEHAGRWLIEAMAADWSAPRLLRSYVVA